ncbi:hypothetical protein [Flavobacterium facile]|uniref:hypothetical protein n=1 Tax=Flavobacterium facile TaxID=2893174 RepID=UPI002E786DB7|nr:hypothetical protein [Flavobacterium sp. T-12]
MFANAQVGIGTTTTAGALDLNPTVATNYGLVTPRVALTSILIEAPEVLFEDYGIGKLVNGEVYINID